MNDSKIPYFTIVVMLTLFTHHLLSIYGPIHWAVLQSAYSISSEAYAENLELKEQGVQSDERNEELLRLSERVKEGGHSALKKSGIYSFTGLIAFILSIVAVFRRKGAVRFAALPFGIYSLSMATIVM